MTEVYCTQNQPTLYLLQSFLEDNGITTQVTNTNLAIIAGEIPFVETWPKLCVDDDAQATRAKELVAEFLSQVKEGDTPSFCPKCDSERVGPTAEATAFQFGKFRCEECGFEWRT